MSLQALSLFSGIGGIDLGLERAGCKIVGQVEIDPYCRRVLTRHWPDVPQHNDVRTCVEWWQSEPRPTVDLICGGFPCQDISNAGRRVGIEGERSGLWQWMWRAIRDLRPRYALLENVSAILVRGLDVVSADLAAIGYDLQWDCIPAASVGAPHRRDRWFGVAYASSQARRRVSFGRRGGSAGNATTAGYVADANGTRPQGLRCTHGLRVFSEKVEASGNSWWSVESGLDRVASGIPARVDRLRALGNAVVPAVAEHVGRLIVDFDRARQEIPA